MTLRSFTPFAGPLPPLLIRYYYWSWSKCPFSPIPFDYFQPCYCTSPSKRKSALSFLFFCVCCGYIARWEPFQDIVASRFIEEAQDVKVGVVGLHPGERGTEKGGRRYLLRRDSTPPLLPLQLTQSHIKRRGYGNDTRGITEGEMKEGARKGRKKGDRDSLSS